MSKPKFVIEAKVPTAVSKAKMFPTLSRPERLQVFLELACYCKVCGALFIDISNDRNRSRATRWLDRKLEFLSHDDKMYLENVWERAIADGREAQLLFKAVKSLQEKYS